MRIGMVDDPVVGDMLTLYIMGTKLTMISK